MSFDDEQRKQLQDILWNMDNVKAFSEVVRKHQIKDTNRFKELVSNIKDEGLKFILDVISQRMMSESSQLYDFAEISLMNTIQIRDEILKIFNMIKKSDLGQEEYLSQLNSITHNLKGIVFNSHEERIIAIEKILGKDQNA